MNTAIAVFVKTPGLSALKTRLAAGIGQDKALEFYHLSLQAIEAVIHDSRTQGFWAVGEKEGMTHPLWAGMQRLHTGDGGLGQRQNHVYETLRHDFESVLLIGADAPQISATLITQAQDAMRQNDYVIGPAHDGGYYLFGGHATVAADIWTNVTYSQNTTCADLIKALPNTPYLLPTLSDVDTQSELNKIVCQMPAFPNTAQTRLIKWIEAL